MYKILLVLFACLSSLLTQAQIYNVSIPPVEQIQASNFRLWIPENVTTLRGVIVHCHGCGLNSIKTPADLQWRNLAKKWNMALMGVNFTGDCNDWAFPEKGSYTALTSALSSFATQSNHPELNTVPWALWGHSGGGNWVYFMTRLYASRIICSYTRTGSGYLPMTTEGLKVPFIIAGGQNELNHPIFGPDYAESRSAFGNMRLSGGLVAWSNEPNALHSCEQTRYMAIPFIDASINLRLPATGNILLDINENTGWLADTSTRVIAAFNNFAGDKTKASWLINETEATSWKEFEGAALVTDLSKPSTPFDITGTVTGNTVTLNWKAEADLQSGMQQFNIYKNGIKIKEVGGQFNRFQWGDFGDEPNPENPAMTTELTNETTCGLYTVSQVNTSQLESDISAVNFNSCSILPIDKIILSYNCFSNGQINVQWQTFNETNVDSFIIEKLNEITKAWVPLAGRPATNNGNSIYRQTIITPSSTLLRIKVLDKNSKFVYSDVLKANCAGTAGKTITVSPNPADKQLQISLPAVLLPSYYSATVVQANGTKLKEYNRLTGNTIIATDKFVNGFYVLIIRNETNEIVAKEKFIVQH
jgi:hypothetical protein